MSHTPRVSSTIDGANSSIKPTANSLRPHYYTSFQNYCCGPKANPKTTTTTATTTATTTNKDLLPIPEKFKSEANRLITYFNEKLVEVTIRIENYTSVIPSEFVDRNDQFKIQKYLIDQGMFRTLKDARIINWISDFKPLYPIKTSGNGNCLLHAVLIAMIGIHDFTLILRDKLAEFMKNNEQILKTHWRTEKLKTDQRYGITSEDANLDVEWKELCASVQYKKSEDGEADTYLEFLEAVHIFALSNMFRRPIIVLSEDVIRNKLGEPISVNDLFGIYLPILSSSDECVDVPIILAYDRSHFCPLQTSEMTNDRLYKNLLPLYLSQDHMDDKTILPIRFLGEDVNVDYVNDLLEKYLVIETVDLTCGSKSPPVPISCAKMGGEKLTNKENFFLLFHDYLMDFFEVQKPKAIDDERQRERQRELEELAAHNMSLSHRSRSAARSSTSPTKFTRTNATLPRDSTTLSSFQPSRRDDQLNQGGYIPSNGAVYIESPRIQQEPLIRPLVSPREAQSNMMTRDNRYYDGIKQSNENRLENITNNNSNGKMVNSVQMQIQGNGSSYSREPRSKTAVPIPVHHLDTRSHASNDTTLTIYEPDRDFSDICLYCNRYFNDVQRRRFCPDCESKIQTTPARPLSPYQTNIRPRQTNMYPPSHDTHQFDVLTPRPKDRPSTRIVCPYCKSPNMLPSQLRRSECHCSACQRPLFN